MSLLRTDGKATWTHLIQMRMQPSKTKPRKLVDVWS